MDASGDYSLSSCGGNWLRLNDDLVTGNLVSAPRWEGEPQMTPMLLDLIADFVQGELNQDALRTRGVCDACAVPAIGAVNLTSVPHNICHLRRHLRRRGLIPSTRANNSSSIISDRPHIQRP